jgi:arylsulfatase A-like enzyme
MRKLHRLVLGLAGWIGVMSPGIAAVPPNILLILSDDQGYADVGVHGCTDFATPHLDSIARNGVRCTNGYVSAPQCAPARVGLLIGRYQQRSGYEFNNDSPGAGLPVGEITLADRLRAAGYVTALVGKWHLGAEEPFHPLNRGFAEFYGFLGGSHHYIPRPAQPAAVVRPSLWRNRQQIEHAKYLTDQLGDEAVAFVARHASRPWFLFLSFNAPHSPLQATPRYLQRVAHIADEKRRTYAAMMTALDDNVGRVLERLRVTGQEERTLVIFLSDNGGPLGNSWNGSSNAPFRGQKGDIVEGGIRVPFFVQWKGTLPAGKVFDAPVISLDILPTALAAAHVPLPDNPRVDGVNLLPAFRGETPLAPRALYWRFNFPQNQVPLYKSAIREGDWKVVRNADRGDDGRPRPATTKLIQLADDPAESRDLTTIEPDRAAALQAKWDAWARELKEPFGGAQQVKENPARARKRAGK